MNKIFQISVETGFPDVLIRVETAAILSWNGLVVFFLQLVDSQVVCCSALSCKQDRSGQKIVHSDGLHCFTLVICQIVVVLFGKHKHGQAQAIFLKNFPLLIQNAFTSMGAYSNVCNTSPWTVGWSVFPSDGIVQKPIPAPACGISSDM